MHIGSLFHWVMGYERSVSGKRSYVSRIVFLRSPRLTERDLKAGQQWRIACARSGTLIERATPRRDEVEALPHGSRLKWLSQAIFSLVFTEATDLEITSGGEDASDGHNHDRRGSGSG